MALLFIISVSDPHQYMTPAPIQLAFTHSVLGWTFKGIQKNSIGIWLQIKAVDEPI